MSTLLREEEDSVGETNSSVPTHCRAENKVVTITLSSSSTTVPRQGNVCHRDPISEDQARTHRPRSSPKSSSGNCITTVDSKGQVIDLVKDQLPDMQLSEEDKRKNLELLQEAKEVSERFLTRRGRRSTSSISDSSTGIGPNPTPYTFPPLCRSGSITAAPQAAADVPEDSFVISSVAQDLRKLTELRSTRPCPAPPSSFPEGTLVPGVNADQRMTRASKKTDPGKVGSDGAREESSVHGRSSRTPDSKTSPMSVARPLPQGTVQRAPCTAEIKTMEAFPPLMRATSWDASGSSPEVEEAPPFVPELLECQESPVQSMKMEKLAKLREEHKLLRNQSIVGSKLPDLSETAELERGSSMDKEPRGQLEVMPNISDVMLHKLKLHRAQTGSAPPLTEREVENAFVQLSLAFRNDNYTLDTRLHQAERERGMTEDNMEKELEEFTGSFKRTAMLWQSLEHRESYQRLLEGVAVLHRLATRLSSRAEMVGAVRQEKRMNKATEVMMQYVENLKRTYEKDHTELMEFKKLANQNSGRGYGTSVDADEGVPRTSRSMSLTMGKALPRRRVSVAVVPKFNLVSIPGQTAVTARPVLPVLCEASSVKVCPPAGPVLQAAPADSGKTAAEQEIETSVPIKPSSPSEEICSEMKAKIEEEAYNRGYQEGLRKSKEMQELKEEEEEEKAEESQKELVRKEEEDLEGITSSSSRFSGFLDIFGQLFPKVFRQKLFFWMALTLVATAFLAFAVFSYFGYHQRELSAGTSLASDKKNLLGWNSRPEEKNGSPE